MISQSKACELCSFLWWPKGSRGSSWEILLSVRPRIFYSTHLLPGDPPYPQLLEPQLLVARAHLMDLYKGKDFSDSENNYYKLPSTVRVLTGLGRLQLFLELCLLLFQALDLLFEKISLSCMLLVGCIKLILHSERFINPLGNLRIFFCKEFSVV